MTSQHPSRSPARRTLRYAGVLIVAAALALLLVGPRVWARGQINLFGLEVASAWAEDTLNPAADACSPDADAEIVQRLQTRLTL